MNMNKLISWVFLPLILSIAMACNSNSEQSEAAKEFELSQFDYLASVGVAMSFDAVLNLLPNDKKTLSDSDIGFVYTWERDSVKHELSAFFYGYETLSELRAIYDFTKNPEFTEQTMMYLHKIQENKYGAPVNYSDNAQEELVQWKETRMEGEYVISLYYEKTKDMITFECAILDKEDLDFQNGTEGEWVQRGPDGEWVWMPYEGN